MDYGPEKLAAIKKAFERNSRAVQLRPAIAQNTAITKVSARQGITCEIEEGSWKFKVDMGEKHGGNNSGPNPGIFGRAALGSCLAITYVTWACKFGIPFESIDVEIHADYDTRGFYTDEGIPPGYRQVTYVVNIQSDAPAAEITRMLDDADAHCAYLDIFANPQKMKRKVNISTMEIAS